MNDNEPTEREYAKAIEKLHTSVEGVQGLNVPRDKPWLNHPDTIDVIVRAFVSDTIKRFALLGGPWTIDDFSGWVQVEADRMNHIFLTYGVSEDTDFSRGVWNTPEQLGKFMRVATNTTGDNAKAVRDAFAALAVNVTTVLADNQGMPIEAWGYQLDALVEEIAAQLLGLPDDTNNVDPD